MGLLQDIGLLQIKREPTEMERTLENLATAEADLKEKLYQLGRFYYLDHKDGSNAEPQYIALLDLISKMDENRKGFYQNRLRLEGKMMCENCGEVVPYGSIYCNACGKNVHEKSDDFPGTPDLDTEMASPTSRCPNCGQAVEENSLFCAECGHKLR